MSENKNLMSIKLFKKDGTLQYMNRGEEAIHKEFVKSLAEGQVIEMLMETVTDDGTNLQLAKIHACMRELAKEIGYSMEELKKEVKRRCGLEGKSFGAVSKSDLGLVIEDIIRIGDTVNINFRGRLPEAGNL